jgi:hypothetical protein
MPTHSVSAASAAGLRIINATVIAVMSNVTLDGGDIEWGSGVAEDTTLYDANLIFGNMSIEEFLIKNRGLKTLSYSVVIPITILYALIFLTGMVGNVAVCTVIARNSSMHTATNYYLFSLALSDLTILLLGEYFYITLLRCHLSRGLNL